MEVIVTNMVKQNVIAGGRKWNAGIEPRLFCGKCVYLEVNSGN